MKNKLLGFYLEAIFSNIFFFLPIYSILFYESLGLYLTQIGILVAIVPLSSLFFEIPTGVFADKYGRKFSTIVGYTIIGLSYLFIFFYTSYAFLIFMNVIIGLGITFVTGARETWMSDLVSVKKLSGFFAKMRSFEAVGSLVSGFVGVLVVSLFDLSSIWLFASISFIVGALMLGMVPSSNKTSSENLTFKQYGAHLRDAITEVQKNSRIKRFVLAFFVLGFAYAFATKLAWIPFIESLGLDIAYFGYVWTLMGVMGIIAPYAGQHLNRYYSDLFSMRILSFLIVVSFLLIYFVHSLWFALLLLVLSLLFDQARIPLEKAYLQSLLSEKKKSTITSLQSLLMSVGLIAGYPLVGLISDAFSSKLVLVIAGVLFLPLLWLYRD